MFLDWTYLVALVVVLTIHEWAHAWVANSLGDPTADRAGRLSLNPLRHLDPIGTLMLFIAGVGWGKPVPVNSRNFKNPTLDEAMVAVAGPLANLILAVVAAVGFVYAGPLGVTVQALFQATFEVSLVLFVFNLLPLPPLDGASFWVLLVPKSKREGAKLWLEKNAVYFLIFLAVDLYGFPRLFGVSLVWSAVSFLTYWIKTSILVLV